MDDGRRAFQHTQQCKLPFRAGRPSAAGRAEPGELFGPGRPAARPPARVSEGPGTGRPRVANAFSTPTDIRRHSGVFEVHGNAISQ